MAKQKDLIALLQGMLPRLASDIDHRTRVLRQGDDPVLPIGGRGPHAPDLRPIDAAHIVISAMSLERPRDGKVEEEVMAMAGLRREYLLGERGVELEQGRGLKGGDRFLDALVMAFTEGFYERVFRITLYPMSRRATIQLCDEKEPGTDIYSPGRSFYFSELDDDHGAPVDVTFEINPYLVNQIRAMLK